MLGLDEQLVELNKEFAVVLVGGKCCILREFIDPITGRADIALLSPADLHNYFANRTVEVGTAMKPKMLAVSKVWMEWAERRQFDGLVFDPAGKHKGGKFYNLFRGMPIRPVAGECALILKHILKVICSGNEWHYRYLIRWLARCVQFPGGERPGICVVLLGRQGTGKGMLLRVFGALFGPHFLHITSGAQLTGRFNSHLKDCLVCFSDEGVWGGDKVAEGMLKGLITEPTIFCEPKGKDGYVVENHVNLIMASNSKWVVPAGLEERRYYVLEVSDCHMQDKVYFKALAEEIENGGQEAFMHHLLNEIDVSEVDLRSPPQTAGLFDQKLKTMRSIEKWWYQLLCDGGFPDVAVDVHEKLYVRPGTTGDWPEWYSTEDLHFAYHDYAKANNDRYADDRMAFTKELIKLCPGLASKRKASGSNRESGLVIPSLSVCRSAFEDVTKAQIEWPSLELLPDQRVRVLEISDWEPTAYTPKSFRLGEMKAQ